jgi:DNA sulfur modification protein DndD
MLFTKVILENYGVYGGVNEFDFTCTPEKPIILIGGTNGAGKTTLFESMLLCLYGKYYFDKRTTKKLYDKFLQNKMHRDNRINTKSKNSSIQIDFKFYHDNEISDYSVNRSWTEEDGKVFEKLVIKKDNEILESIDESQWQSFIDELIPKGISKLFFFDGEKIVKIAESENTEIELKSSFDSLLGVDLVEQLQSDLKIYVLRKQGSNYARIEEEIKIIKEKRDELSDKYDEAQDTLSRDNEELDAIIREIDKIENNLSKIGGGYATRRTQLKEQKVILEGKLKDTKSQIAIDLHQGYPFALIPNILDEIQVQINSEQENLKHEIVTDVLDKKKSEIESILNDSEFLKESHIEQKSIQILNERISNLLVSDYDTTDKKIFNYSLKESSDLTSDINQYKRLSDLRQDSKKYNEYTDELNKVDLGLTNASQIDETSNSINRLTELSKNQGGLESDIKKLERDAAFILAQKKIESNSIQKVLDKQFKDQDKTTAVELAKKLDNVLKLYVQKLRIQKIEKFEIELVGFIKDLMHKDNFIEKVTIDPDTFEINLYKKNGDEIFKSNLSKGEQQMLATSILWSLAKTSGKPLPFMVDTPLARLDVKHRNNLIDNFYPGASHQLVIFSTNSEIDAKYHSALFKYISKSYAITFVPEEGRSKVSSGYFWNEKGESLIAIR